MIADGTYDVIVVDAAEVGAAEVGAAEVGEADPDGEDPDGGPAVRLELTIVAGPYKGDTVVVRARHLTMSAVDALGLPGRLFVADRLPRVELET